MAYAGDLKSLVRKNMRVQVPQGPRMKRKLLFFLLVGCSRTTSSSSETTITPTSASAAPTPSASASAAAKPTSGPPSALPFCKMDAAVESLAAFCEVGADQSKAQFKCARPEPISFCGNVDEWMCRAKTIGGSDLPPVQFSAFFDHVGPPIKSGDSFSTDDMSKLFPRTGSRAA
jgi:hypothetical protein